MAFGCRTPHRKWINQGFHDWNYCGLPVVCFFCECLQPIYPSDFCLLFRFRLVFVTWEKEKKLSLIQKKRIEIKQNLQLKCEIFSFWFEFMLNWKQRKKFASVYNTFWAITICQKPYNSSSRRNAKLHNRFGIGTGIKILCKFAAHTLKTTTMFIETKENNSKWTVWLYVFVGGSIQCLMNLCFKCLNFTARDLAQNQSMPLPLYAWSINKLPMRLDILNFNWNSQVDSFSGFM